jgi:zinc transporter
MTSSCVIHEHLLGDDRRVREYNGDPTSGIHWTHIEYTNPGALGWLMNAGLPEVAAETMTRTETRPRVFTFDQGTLLNLRGVNLNPGEDPEDMVSVRLWLAKGRIITARQRRVISIEDMLQDFEKGKGPASEGEFLVSLVEHIASRIGEAVDTIDDQIARFEDELGTPSDTRAPLSKIRRQTAALRRFLAPQREALESMYRVSRDWLDENEAHYLREQADRITRYVEDLDLNRERTLVLQEELQNRIAQEQNSRGFLLTIIVWYERGGPARHGKPGSVCISEPGYAHYRNRTTDSHAL